MVTFHINKKLNSVKCYLTMSSLHSLILNWNIKLCFFFSVTRKACITVLKCKHWVWSESRLAYINCKNVCICFRSAEFITELVFGRVCYREVFTDTQLFSDPEQRPGGWRRLAISYIELGKETKELPHRGGVSALTLLTGKEMTASVKDT